MRRTGFSIVELAIVLVIISLLISAVLAGGKLLNQAKLRSVINDFNMYKNAYNTFYLTYDELPGDMKSKNALAYFGETHSYASLKNGKEGDMIINGYVEGIIALWHLKLAKIISGEYDGRYQKSEIVGVTVGSAKYADDAGFFFFATNDFGNAWHYEEHRVYRYHNKNILAFGKVKEETIETLSDSVLKPADAYNIDRKLDDGLPNSGNIAADHGEDVGSNSQCTNLDGYAISYKDSDGALSYMTQNQDAACRMMFLMDL